MKKWKGVKEVGFILITEDEETKIEIGTYMHNQLIGNKDYIDSKILLNIDEPCKVQLFVDPDVKELPDF